MNSLDDLRRTLDAHAHDGQLDHTGNGVDRAGLASRIAGARRRRTAVRGGLALAAVVAIASAAFVPGLLANDEPAPAGKRERTVLGQVAPATKTALGLTYAWESATATDSTTSVTLEPSIDDDEEPPLLTWTTSDPEAEVTVTDDAGTLLWTSRIDGFADHVVLDQYPDLPVTVTSSEPGVAAATYSFDPEVEVAGHTEGGVTFPEVIADQRLVAANVSAPGAFEADVEVSEADLSGAKSVSIVQVCTGFDDEVTGATTLNGDQVTVGDGCNTNPGVVHHTQVSWELAERPAPSTGTYAARVVRTNKDSALADPSVGPNGRVGIAVYVSDELPDVDFHGFLQPRVQAWGGHLWELVASANGTETSTADSLDTDTLWLASAAAVVPPGGSDEDAATLTLAVAADGEEIVTAQSFFTGSNGRSGISTRATLLPARTRSATVPEKHLTGTSQHLLLAWRLVD